MKVELYIPKIEDGIPLPDRSKASYTRKIVDGELLRIAERIRPNQSVLLPVGSIGKFKRAVHARGFAVISQAGQEQTEARVWVIDRKDA